MAYPKHAVATPKALIGRTNGKLPDSILEDIPGLNGGPVIRLLKDTAARAWKAMTARASADGVLLSATSAMDSYRPYDVQERIFRQRYTTTRLAGRPSRVWNGRTYWQKVGVAAAAVPGTSNHGKAMAVDNKNTTKPALAWLLKHAAEYGWSWEIDSEPWHIHYFAGDNIPQAVLDYERGSGTDTTSEDDDMLPGFDKSPEDVARGTIRSYCDLHWGKGKMTTANQEALLRTWRDSGREAMMIKLLDDPKNVV